MVPALVALTSSCLLRLASGDALGVYEVELRTEGRLRAPDGAGPQPEAEATPRLTLGVHDRRYEMNLSYAPRVTWREADGGDVRVLHRAAVLGTWSTSPAWRASCRVEGAYGLADLTRLVPVAPGGGAAATPPAGAEPIATRQLLRYGSLSALLSLEGRPGPREQLRLALGASVDGGLGADGSALPVERDVRGAGSFGWSVTRRTTLATELRSRFVRFASGEENLLAAVDGRWALTLGGRDAGEDDSEADAVPSAGRGERRWDAELWAAGGAGAGRDRRVDATRWLVAPAAEVGYRHGLLAAKLEGRLAVRVGPESDRLTAAVYERADVSAALSWRPLRGWTVDLTASGGRVLGGDQAGQTVTIAELSGTWWPATAVGLTAGVRSVRQAQVTAAASFDEWPFYVGMRALDRETF
jgi:hypothetical protein